MAVFLDTTGVSYYLQQLINKANEKLILISPYLQINEKIKQSLEDKDRLKIDIRVVYGKNKLQPEENDWLMSMNSIRTSFCKNLHAKCYLSENAAIITSMNLYDFSQINNNEMGIYVEKETNTGLYQEVFNEVQRLIRISDEEAKRLSKNRQVQKTEHKKKLAPDSGKKGYCIRTGVEIPFDINRPLCPKAFKEWNRYGNPDYTEAYCHFSGELSNGKTSVKHPILSKNWEKARSVFNF